jgi:hypothetical protein
MRRSVAVHRVTGRMNTRQRPPAPRLEAVCEGEAAAVAVTYARLPRVPFRRAELRDACARVSRRRRLER